jgi:hypothetical protein
MRTSFLARLQRLNLKVYRLKKAPAETKKVMSDPRADASAYLADKKVMEIFQCKFEADLVQK